MYPCMFSYAGMLMCRALSQPTAPREGFKALRQHIHKQFWQAWEILSQDKRERELSKTKTEIWLTVTVSLNMYYSPERKAGYRRLLSEAMGILSWILIYTSFALPADVHMNEKIIKELLGIIVGLWCAMHSGSYFCLPFFFFPGRGHVTQPAHVGICLCQVTGEVDWSSTSEDMPTPGGKTAFVIVAF